MLPNSNINSYAECSRHEQGDQDPHAYLVAPAFSAIIDENTVEKWLGLNKNELKALIAARHLVPLGKQRPKTQKRFAAVYILGLRKNLEWLATARNIITSHWRKINSRRRKKYATKTG